MNYTKPEVTVGWSALTAIQGNGKPSQPVNYDNQPPNLFTATMQAYEADE